MTTRHAEAHTEDGFSVDDAVRPFFFFFFFKPQPHVSFALPLGKDVSQQSLSGLGKRAAGSLEDLL